MPDHPYIYDLLAELASGGVITGVGAAHGTATAPGIGQALWSNVGTANGTATAPGIGAAADATVGTANGTATAPGIGKAAASGVGTATGLGTAPGIGASVNSGVGSAVGAATAPGIGQALWANPATTIGLGAAPGIGAAEWDNAGEADGLGAAPGIGSTGTAPVTKAVAGWFEEWGKRRRIPVEQLRAILKEQGNPWADELGDVVAAVAPKSPKHQEVIETAVDEIVEKAAQPVDWGLVIGSLRASASAKRTTLAIKHADAALAVLRARFDQDNDDEEAITLLLYG